MSTREQGRDLKQGTMRRPRDKSFWHFEAHDDGDDDDPDLDNDDDNDVDDDDGDEDHGESYFFSSASMSK